MRKEQIIRKGWLVGVGLAAFAKEKAEKLVKELAKKGHVNTAEGKKLVRTIYREAEKSGKKVSKVMEAELKKVIKTVKAPVKKKKAAKKRKVVKKRKAAKRRKKK